MGGRGVRWGGLVLLVVVTSGWVSAVPASAHRRLGVGDSIMLSAEDDLLAHHVHVNAVVGRQFDEGLLFLKRLAARDSLPSVIIVHLGTNGPIDPSACDAVTRLAGTSRRVFLLTLWVPRPWEVPNNAIIDACAGTEPRVNVIRWHDRSVGHPGWFAGDGYHLTPLGQRSYAAIVVGAVRGVLGVINARRAAA